MKQAKNIIQRNLPINQQYTLLETFYSSIEDSGTCCENCGRPISNIAKVIGNNDKLIRLIGMDCAETLTSIKDSLAFEKYAFQAGKTARAAIMKMLKKAKEQSTELEIKIQTFAEGEGYYKQAGSGWYSITPLSGRMMDFRTWKQYPKHQWQSHVLPMIKDFSTIK